MYIDVRTHEEWNEGHKNGALHHELTLLMQGIMPDIPKDSEIIVYCRSGNRSEMAKEILEHNGFTCVSNGGGITDV